MRDCVWRPGSDRAGKRGGKPCLGLRLAWVPWGLGNGVWGIRDEDGMRLLGGLHV